MRQARSRQSLCRFIAAAVAATILIIPTGKIEGSLDDALPDESPPSHRVGNPDAGLGDNRDEILTALRKISSRATAFAQQATAHAEITRRMTDHGRHSPEASAQAALAARSAAKSREAATEAEKAANAASISIDLDLMRDLERRALRAETQADASARASKAAWQAAQRETVPAAWPSGMGALSEAQ
ncbi:hypothetical protein ABZX75_34065 [Streptomyces sp. NPDC003038]|uniref:hypothetical protein n=1 Tax=unclassified Streptomyces TaxID=2593676 RepID=UPI0033A2A381